MKCIVLAVAFLGIPLAAEEPQQAAPAKLPGASALVESAPYSGTSPQFPRLSYFKERFSTPSTHVELRPPVRIEDFVHGGKIELSLRDYTELVLANNTDIAIQRLSLDTAKVNLVGSFNIFDPAFIGSFSTNRAKTLSTSQLEGASVSNALTQKANFTYSQMLQTGTNLSVGFGGTKNSSNNLFATFNPSIGASMSFNFTQPLLRNRGMYITRIPISIARSTLRKSEYDLTDSVTRLISDAENAYWDVINARENLKVQQKYLEVNGAFLERSKRELKLGAISALDIYRPEQTYASAEIAVSRFTYQLRQVEDALRRYIGADLKPEYRKLEIVLTETVMPPAAEAAADPEQMVQKALATRPDLKSAVQSIDLDDLSLKQATNGLRPDLSLTAGYLSAGTGGNEILTEGFGPDKRVIGIAPGGFTDAWGQLWNFNSPTYTFGLTLRLPLRDRKASAAMANALIAKKRDALAVRSTEQRVRLDVLNAINQLESAKAGVDLAVKAVDFAQKQADAEQKKYDLGTSIAYFVLSAQADLVSAQSQLVGNSISYRRAKTTLLRATGELLEQRGVVLQ